MSNYYNEFEPYAAQWIRNLIKAGHIPDGEVDERSITEVQPEDLEFFTQCHFFAGIAGWSLAARLARWPDDRELWTGSAPCQPYSVAGNQLGTDDERDLWPHYFRLIAAARPAVCMGEQVAAAIGKHWLDRVFADLEGVGYACGAAVLPACAVNAPHRRDRIAFVAGNRAMGHCVGARLEGHTGHVAGERGQQDARGSATPSGLRGTVDDARRAHAEHAVQAGRNEYAGTGNAWSDSGWIVGHDGKARRVGSGVRLLVDGLPSRVGRLRAYGNAIAPPLFAEVIKAWMDVRP